MIELILATLNDISVCGLLYLIMVVLMGLGRNIFYSADKLWFRIVSTAIFIPIWVAVLFNGGWLSFATYALVTNSFRLFTMKYSVKEETLEKLQEADEAGMLSCLMFFVIPLSICLQALFFGFFQWIR